MDGFKGGFMDGFKVVLWMVLKWFYGWFKGGFMDGLRVVLWMV